MTLARLTPSRGGNGPDFEDYPVYQSVAIYLGTMVAINSSGYAVPFTATTGLKSAGIARLLVRGPNGGAIVPDLGVIDNTSGSSGDVWVRVEKGASRAFALDNSDVAPVSRANIGDLVYAEDDRTISRTSQSSTLSPCGILEDYVAAAGPGSEQQQGVATPWVTVGSYAQVPNGYISGYQ
jgi:hypothetical protein